MWIWALTLALAACGRIGFDEFQDDVVGESTQIDADVPVDATDATLADATIPVDAVPGQAHLVFLTTTTHLGSLGGVAGADSECQARATAAGLQGTYLAWLSSAESDAPATRFVRSDGPYQLVDGTVIANNWDDLTDQSILAPLDKDEFGAQTTAARFWTNVDWKGTFAGSLTHCTAWFGLTFSGNVGDSTATNPSWTNAGNISCINTFPIACFEQ